MRTSYEFKGDIIVITAKGDVTIREVFETVKRAINRPSFRPGMGCLIHDFESGIILNFNQVKECVDFQKSIQNQISSMALVVYEKMHYEFGRIISALCENYGLNHQVFYSLKEAQRWLKERIKLNMMELITR